MQHPRIHTRVHFEPRSRRLAWRRGFAHAAWAVLAGGAIALSLVADMQLGQVTANGIAAMQAAPVAPPVGRP